MVVSRDRKIPIRLIRSPRSINFDDLHDELYAVLSIIIEIVHEVYNIEITKTNLNIEHKM